MDINCKAWDKVNKKMYQVAELEYSTHGDLVNVVVFDNKSTTGKRLLSTNHILIQDTGLADKNEKEIYEDDIVKYTRVDCFGGHTEICRVKYHCAINGCYFFPFVEFNAGKVTEAEVIGNIYENPKLLKEGGK